MAKEHDIANLPELAFPCQCEHLDALVIGVSYSNAAILEGAVSYTLEEGNGRKAQSYSHHSILLQVSGLDHIFTH